MSKLSTLYPYYGPLGRGNFNVSLAFPGPLSTISKNIGLKTSTGLILPNTDYIQKFAQGDLGIGDSIITNMIYKNMNSSIAGKNESVFRQFAKNSGIELDSDISKYKKGNKFVLPKDSIKIPDGFNMAGFKAFEKTVFQSIFETQKPFIEIVQFAIGSVIKAEDIIARVMPLFGSNPLKTKSRKPVGNAGDSSRPKALGYKGGSELKTRLQTLQQIKSKDETFGLTSSINVNNAENLTIKNNLNQSGINSQRWQILSTVYSTGLFNPNVDYTYSYINLPADSNLPDVEPIELETPDPFESYKPKTIILGIYNSKGIPLDPSEYITTVGLDGDNNITRVTTPYKRAEWLLKSPKWKLPENMIEWPNFSTPNFIWEKNGLFGAHSTKVGPKNPDGYDLKKYKEGDINIITGVSAIPNDPVIQSFDKIEEDSYRKYYSDIVEIGLLKEKYLSESERIIYSKDINDRIEIDSQLEITYNYGNTKTSFYNRVDGKVAFPNAMKKSYKPFQVYVSEAEKDLDLVTLANKKGIKPGYIWVDPEADYDLKVIRIDAATTDTISNFRALNTTKRIFIKNRVNFSFSNKSIFSISISKNNTDVQTFNDVTNYSLENWNYDNKIVKNTNTFVINIWSKIAPKKYSDKNYYEFPITNTYNNNNNNNEKLNYNIRKIGDKWLFDSNDKNYVKNGIVKLEDKTAIYVDKGIITKWFYIYNQTFKGPNKGVNLPTFGIDRDITINYENNNLDVTDKTIPIWGILKPNNTSNILINSTIVTNDFLSTADLFIKPENGYYGHGSDDDPQDLGIIDRYSITDTDDESYYIVEGILKSENEFPTDDDGNRIKGATPTKGGGGWYRLPHAIGAGSVFIRLLIDIAIKMLPKIIKLLKLFKDPASFVTDIMAEKLKKNFSFLSDDAISILQKSNEFRSQVTSQTTGIDNLNNLINKTRLDSRKLQDKIINDSYGKSSLEQSQAKKMISDINNNTELQISQLEEIGNKKKQVVQKLRKYYKDSILSNYVYLDDKNLETIFTLDGSATTPLKIFGLDLSFGLASNMGSIPDKKPIELIFPKSKGTFKNLQYLTNKPKTNKDINSVTKQEIIDLKTPIQSKLTQLDKQPPYTNSTVGELYYSDKVQIKFQDGTSEYIPSNSLQNFVKENENKYNFIYVTEGLEKTLAQVNNLLQSGTQQDLNDANELLDQARKDFPNNTTINDKQKELDAKNSDLVKNTQPLLKTLLGFVKFPIKLVADIIQWLFDFFKSLTNPMKLASKMKEFLSFEWILKYFTPTGILEIFGVKFNPAVLVPFASEAALSSGKLPNISGVPTINNVTKMDLSKFLNIGFIPTLPTYTADQYKNLLKGTQPIRSLSILKMMEEIINKIIDFIWSLFGIEALIKAPHIKIISDNIDNMSPENIKKIIDGIEPMGNTNIIDNNPITNNGESNEINTVNPAVDTFIYYITLPDGTQQQYLNREELDTFIQEHKDINYDFTF